MKLRRAILRLAVPSILANITVPLVGMVDLAVAGHLQGDFSAAAFIGGISIGSMLFELLYWNFSFLRTGTGGLTAQAYGRGDVPYQAYCLRRALGIAFISGVALIVLQWLIVQGAFLVVECSPEVRQLAEQYFYIRIWAAPATISLFAFKGWFIGMQDSVRAMAADLTVNVVNIAASIGFALLLGFKGIALGTVLAQWSGFAYCCFAIMRRYRFVIKGPPDLRGLKLFLPKKVKKVLSDSGKALPVIPSEVEGSPRIEAPGSFFRMNRNLVIRSMSMIAVYIGFTVISARHGDLMLASAAILMKMLMLFSYFSDGFAYAGEALTGRFIGEAEKAEKSPLRTDGVRSTIRGTFLWGGGCALLFLAIYGLGGVPLLRLFSGDSAVVEAARQFLPWLMLMPVIGIPAFIWDGIYTGATRTRDMMLSVVLCAIGFFATYLSGFYLLKADDVMAIHILMAAYFVHLAIRSAYLTLRWRFRFVA